MAEQIASGSGGSRFRYRARDAAGRLHRGELGGADAYSVRTQLRTTGFTVESLTPVVEHARGPFGRWLDTQRCKRRRTWRADWFDAVAVLLRAGLPLEQALGQLAESPGRGGAERRTIERIRDRLRSGASLSEAVTPCADYFDRLDVAVLAAGQAAGELPAILDSLGEHHQRASQAGHRLAMALVYPVVVGVLSAVVVAKLGADVLPQFVALLEDSGEPVPALTASVVTVGTALTNWWWLGVPLLCVGHWSLRRWLVSLPARGWLGRWVHGNLMARAKRRARVADLGETLATVLGAGVPLDEALVVAADTTGERALAQLLRTASTAVRDGEDLSVAVAHSPLLDPEFVQLLALGEQAGELPATLSRIAARARRAADRTAERVAAVIEPVAVLSLAVMIGLIVLSVVVPLTRLGAG